MDQLYHVKYIFLKLKLMKSVSQLQPEIELLIWLHCLLTIDILRF